MIDNLIKKYNENRRSILTIIIIIAFSYIFLQLVFGLMKTNNKRKIEQLMEQYNKEQIENSIYQNNAENNTAYNNSNNIEENTEKAIEKFVMYCNQNKIEKAYSMLSNDCKSVLFPTINKFENNYIKNIFTKIRSALIEESIYGDSIYKVTYTDDILSSGIKNNSTIIDYIYVEKSGEEYTLSLNKFLYTKKVEKESYNESVNIKIIEKQVFIDYEIYTIEINNYTSNEILLANRNNVNNICLIDENEVNYSSYIDELTIEDLIVQKNGIKTINIKFNKAYNKKRKLKYISFSTIMNYKAYIKGQESEIMKQIIEL